MRSRASAYALLGLLSVPAVALGVGGLLAGSAAAAEGECGGKPVTVDLSMEGQAPTEGDDVILLAPDQNVTLHSLGGNDVICFRPGSWPNCRSSGAVTPEAITSGLAPG